MSKKQCVIPIISSVLAHDIKIHMLSHFNNDEDSMELYTSLLIKICQYLSYNEIKFINKKFNKVYIKFLTINARINEDSIVNYNNWNKRNNPNIKHMIIYNKRHITTPTMKYFPLINDSFLSFISRNLVSLLLTFNIGKLINNLPNTLKSLHLDQNFNDIIHKYPKYIKEVRFNFKNHSVYTTTNKYIVYISDSVEKIKLPDIEPNSMEIYNGNNGNLKILDIGSGLTRFPFHLFPKVETLVLGNNFNHPISYFENNLSSIIMRSLKFDNSIYSFNNLKELYLVGLTIHNKITFSRNLEKLSLICGYSFQLDNLPSSLKLLLLGNFNDNDDDFSYDLRIIPNSIETLILDDLYNITQEPVKLPTSLKTFGYYDEQDYLSLRDCTDLTGINIIDKEGIDDIDLKRDCDYEYTYTNYEEINWYK